MALSLIQTLFHEGTISTLYGAPDSGKTNLAVVLMEKAVEQGFNIWTVIRFFTLDEVDEAINMKLLAKPPETNWYRKKPEEIHTISKLSELILGLLEGGKCITILDEAGIFGSSSSPTSTRVKTLKQLAYIIRHLNSSLMLIAQSKGSIVPDLRETLVQWELRIRKIGKRQRMFSIACAQNYIDVFGEEHTEFVITDEIIGVPLARYPYDSKYFPSFEIDLDLTEVLERLSKYNSIEVLKNGKKEIMRMMREKGIDADIERKEVISPEYAQPIKIKKPKPKIVDLSFIDPPANNEYYTNEEIKTIVNKIIEKYNITLSYACELLGRKLGRSGSWVYYRFRLT